MIDENLISDISYTSKDFNSIYPELLDLVKKLSTKWDPSLSNESDPGVLLLKLNAIIADKNNYNIDKNILECFPLSVTQESNARKIYNLLGYNMHWFKSATTEIGFTLKDGSNIPNEGLDIPIFTPIVDSSKELMFTTLEKVTLYPTLTNITQNTLAIQGSILDYDINSNRKITFDNLDNDFRLYFKDNRIAQNGIFIADATTENPDNAIYENELLLGGSNNNWKRVDNLAAYPLNNKVFQFGVLPNSNTCYIQFPEDIATLIPNGMYIKYTITDGLNGNIKNATLSLFLNDILGKDNISVNSDIKISQPIGTSNGLDPETISDAYKNYKKTIGTFNNLITNRDYQNYIYNIEEENEFVVSNLVVSDRTNDLNYSDYVQVWYPHADVKEPLFRTENNESVLNAYNIVLYLLNKPISIYDVETYNQSFLPDVDLNTMYEIESQIDDIKAIQHDMLNIENSILPQLNSYKLENDTIYYKKFMFNNLCTLKGNLVTYNKITSKEAENIEKNVLNALYKNYNGREVDFGQAINYDQLIKTIQNADPRIKTVILNIPTYNPTLIAYYGDRKVEYLDPNNDTYIDINNELVARMILSGNVQLFKFEEDFQLDFGQNDIDYYESKFIRSITTKSERTLDPIDSNGTPFTVNKNESIQILQPSLITEVEYGAWVNVSCSRTDQESEVLTIKPGIDTVIPDNMKIDITYKNTSGLKEVATLLPGTVIQSSIELTTGLSNAENEVTSNSYVLESGQTIKVKTLNQTNLEAGTLYYFLLNNSENRLTLDIDNSYILQENEYFIYTTPTTDELIILGSGTQLSSNEPYDQTIPRIDMDLLTNENKNKIDWYTLNQQLITTELNIIALGEGVKITKFDGNQIIIDNDPKQLSGTELVYEYEGQDFTVKITDIKNIPTRIQSRLFINATQYEPQELLQDQSFVLDFVDGTKSAPITDKLILFNNPIRLSGGNNIDVKVLNEYGESAYTLKALSYTQGETNNQGIERLNSGYFVLNKANSANKTVEFNFNFKANTKYFIPIYVNIASLPGNTITFNNCILNYPTGTNSLNTDIGINQSYILYINNTEDLAKISIEVPNLGENDSITIGQISQIIGYNKEEIDSNDNNYPYSVENNVDKIESIINEIISNSKTVSNKTINFDWNYKVPEINKVLNPTLGEAYWNQNHIYNKYTLPKINFNESSLKISPSSLI